VLVVIHAEERRRKELLVTNKEGYITLAVNLKILQSKSCKVECLKSCTFDFKIFDIRQKNEECLVAQLVRVLH
jgi:hypothetical protein